MSDTEMLYVVYFMYKELLNIFPKALPELGGGGGRKWVGLLPLMKVLLLPSEKSFINVCNRSFLKQENPK